MSPDSPLAPPGGGGEASGSTFDQRGQQVQTQINIAGDVKLASVDGWLPYDASVELVAHAPPADFVARKGPFEEAQRWLLDSGKAPVAIVGPGGFGKTTLVQALCQDEAVRERFGAGVRWVQLAEEPSDLLGVISDLVVRLGRPRPDFRTVENATKALIEALGDQTLLLVIDNVWRVEELTPLLKGGPNCVRLMTTRDPLLAPAGTHVVELEVMSEAEAVQLLTADLPEVDEFDAVGLARQLHCWPLLLRLIKCALFERLTHEALALAVAWQSICADLRDFGITAFDDPRNAVARDRAVRVSLDISQNQLTPDERECYSQLTIFPTAVIHWSALGRLWGMELGRTRMLCRKLHRLSLIALNEGARTCWLHDVFRGYLQNEQRDKLVMLQRRFLDSYNLRRWVELPADEPYLWDHLVYHLIAAGRTADLADLFADDGWLQVRVARDGYVYDGYLADLTQAWQLAHMAVHRTTDGAVRAAHLATCIHYALIRTSINALAGNYHPALVVRAVELGLWTIDRALSTAYRVPDPEARARMITALLATKRGSAEQRSVAVTRALEAALALWNDEHRAYALAALAPHLTGQQRIEALNIGLTAILSLQEEGRRVYTLAALAPHLTGDLLVQGLEAALALQGDWERAEALVGLVPYLTGDLLARGLTVALALQDKGSQVRVLVALAPHLTDQQHTQVLTAGIAVALTLQDEWSRARALMALAPYLTGDLLEQGLAAVMFLQDTVYKARALAVLAPQLAGQHCTEILKAGLTAALVVQHESFRARALTALAPLLTGDLLEQGLAAALVLQDESCRAETLAALAPQLTGQQRTQTLDMGLATALALRHERDQVRILGVLAPQLAGQQRTQALTVGLAAALALQDNDLQEDALAALAPQLMGDLLQQGLVAALALQDEEARARVLAVMVPQLTEHQRTQAIEAGLAAAMSLQDEKRRIHVLMTLAPYLMGDLLEQVLLATLALQDEWRRAETLVTLAPQLTGDLLEQGLAAAMSLQDEGHRAWILGVLAYHLDGQQRTQTLKAGLAAALTFQKEGRRVRALAALVPQLTGSLLEQGLAAALTLQDEWHRARALAALAPRLGSGLLYQGLAAALTIQNEWHRARALAALAPQLTDQQRTQILKMDLAAALALQDEWRRVNVLTALAPQLSGDLLQQGLTAALALQNVGHRAEILAALAPQLSDDLLGQDRAVFLVQTTVADYLWYNLQTEERNIVLYFLSNQAFFSSPVMDLAAVGAIAQSILDICWKWRWV